VIELEGDPALLARFADEAGGHRWQRVPPTERRGRVQTSTVTVAALPVCEPRDWGLREGDIRVFTARASGAGGQHVNRTESAVVMRHLPTGLEAKAASKSQHDNRRQARRVLEARVAALYASHAASERDAQRRSQVGSGARGEKVRTYREVDDRVLDERTGRKVSLARLRERGLQVLWR
jgi:peptide chain release factor 1